MVKRPTIPDVAKAAGVSVSTVNRVINDANSVRLGTRERVLEAARQIGFYGTGSIEHSVRAGAQTHQLGILLQQGTRTFYRNLGAALRHAAETMPDCKVNLTLEFLEDLSPDKIARHIVSLGERCEVVAVVAPQHPLIADAIDQVIEMSVPVVALIGPLSARGNVSFVGLDNWKVGRTAAWGFDKMVRDPGKIAILVGNHRFRNQEMNESGFRSYFREHNSNFTLLEPLTTYESAAIAQELVETTLKQHPDLCGLFISGGGITGALSALRNIERRDDFVTVGYELFDATRSALLDGTLTMVISHPMERFAQEAITTMIRAKNSNSEAGALRVALNFDIYTSENV